MKKALLKKCKKRVLKLLSVLIPDRLGKPLKTKYYKAFIEKNGDDLVKKIDALAK